MRRPIETMISLIIPFYNEAENLPILINQLYQVLKTLNGKYEIILVNDGSDDDSLSALANLKVKRETLKIMSHRKRLGKGKALNTGFKAATGDIIIFMDADLQDDPRDIPLFLQKISRGYELVNGWRVKRNDGPSKTWPSYIFNTVLLKLFFHSRFHDINCGFKAMKRTVLNDIPLYGDNYRFLPIMAEQAGFKTTEVAVQHHPRKFGKSKYNALRLFFGVADTVTTYFVYRFSDKPLHFFGPIGAICFAIGSLIVGYYAIERLFFGMLLYRRPLILYGILLIIVGLQITMTGIIAELIVYLQKKNS